MLSLLMCALGCIGTKTDAEPPVTGIDDTGRADSDPQEDDSGPHTGDSAPETGDSAPPLDTGPFDEDGDGAPASEDCDDTDSAVNPGAPEVAETTVDEDCDGYVDLDVGTASDATAHWIGTDGFEGDVNWLGLGGVERSPDLDADGYPDLALGTYDSVLVVPGASLWGAGETHSAEMEAVGGIAWENVGVMTTGYWCAVAEGADSDGDGDVELVAAGQAELVTGNWEWVVAVFPSDSLRTSPEQATFDAAFLLVAEPTLSMVLQAGTLEARGDFDGDGLAEVVSGNQAWEYPYGAVLVVEGVDVSLGGRISEAEASSSFQSEDGGTGSAVRLLPDLTGDGHPELWVGAGRHVIVDGAAVVGRGEAELLTEALVRFDDLLFVDVLDAGDVDGDERHDLLVATGNDVPFEARTWSQPITVWLDLGEGGSRGVADADVLLTPGDGEYASVQSMAAGALRRGGEDLLVSFSDGVGGSLVAMMPFEDLPTSGKLDLSTRPDTLTPEGRDPIGPDGLRLLDLDLDGDDDVIAVDVAWGRADPNYPAGRVTLYGNPG